ncbi:MAG: DUF6152 family protein [Gammaproteobacteria bacterium]
MKTFTNFMFGTVAGLFLPAVPLAAHHSDAGLAMDEIYEVEGTVIEYSMRNPHSYIVVEMTDGNGEAIEFEVQMASALTISRRGWTRDTLSAGDQVRVGVRPSISGRPYGLIDWIEINGEPRMMEETIAGVASGAALAEQATTDTIEGIWIVDDASLGDDYPGGFDQLASRDLTPTEAGRRAQATYDQNSEENPEVLCISKPTPSLIVYTDLYPLQIELDDAAETITIRTQYFDAERTIYMDGRDHPPTAFRSHEGHSTGRWEGDTLVIDTTNFTDHRSPYQNGVPNGAQKHVVERYRLHEDGTRLNVEFFLEDPEYIVGSMTHSRDLIYSPQIEMTPFDCDLEATRRFLPEQ